MPVDRESGDGLDHLGLLASPIAGRPVQVSAARPGAPPWTDARTIFVDPQAAPRVRTESIVVQASLVAAGSLDSEMVRSLGRGRSLARRYLAVEGHRALASIRHLLPPSIQSLIDPSVAERTRSPRESLTEATSRSTLPTAPESFGVIRPRQLLASLERSGPSTETGPPVRRDSTRVLVAAGRLAAEGLTPPEAARVAIAGPLTDDASVMRDLVEMIDLYLGESTGEGGD